MALDDLLGGKGALDALKEWFGVRHDLRRTFGDPALTRAIILCDVLEERFKITGMQQVRDQLLHGRAGEQGWDTEMSIRAAEAVSPKGMKLEQQAKPRE
jgi:hypothetical protein